MRDDDEFEIMEYDIELLTIKDYEGLLHLRRNQIIKYPNSYEWQYKWAEVLILTKKFKEAIEVLGKMHKDDPHDEDVVDLIISYLKGIKNELEDYEWIVKPKIIKLDEELIDLLKNQIKHKRGDNRRLFSVYSTLIMKDHLFFSEIELFEFLKSSKRVRLSKSKDWFDTKIEKIE